MSEFNLLNQSISYLKDHKNLNSKLLIGKGLAGKTRVLLEAKEKDLQKCIDFLEDLQKCGYSKNNIKD